MVDDKCRNKRKDTGLLQNILYDEVVALGNIGALGKTAGVS